MSDLENNGAIPVSSRLSTYDYHLPPHLIAQEPARQRDESRLFVVHRKSGHVMHRLFRDLPPLLRTSDLLVLNETKVVPAALTGYKASGGRVELLVLDPAVPLQGPRSANSALRICLVRSSKPLRAGAAITIDAGPDIVTQEGLGPGRALVDFAVEEDQFLAFLDSYGTPPLPPYIRPESRRVERDRERYQTVYAKTEGSVAAPTAGLHFTRDLLCRIEDLGVSIARIVLHVGPGTFNPVRHEDIRAHQMEKEAYEIPGDAADLINRARQENRRIIGVGTTCVRALESAVDERGILMTGAGETNLFITPGYTFRLIDGMITNFHLPRSTLFILVCALAGTGLMLRGYEEAVRLNYRFYSYGDASLIVD